MRLLRPHTNYKTTDQTFIVRVVSTWNSLLPDILSSRNSRTFRQSLLRRIPDRKCNIVSNITVNDFWRISLLNFYLNMLYTSIWLNTTISRYLSYVIVKNDNYNFLIYICVHTSVPFKCCIGLWLPFFKICELLSYSTYYVYFLKNK